MFRTILKISVIALPWILMIISLMFSGVLPLSNMGITWLIISPFWAAFVAFLFFWEGRAIAVIDTAKDVISTVQDNKHHAVNAFNFVKSRVQK